MWDDPTRESDDLWEPGDEVWDRETGALGVMISNLFEHVQNRLRFGRLDMELPPSPQIPDDEIWEELINDLAVFAGGNDFDSPQEIVDTLLDAMRNHGNLDDALDVLGQSILWRGIESGYGDELWEIAQAPGAVFTDSGFSFMSPWPEIAATYAGRQPTLIGVVVPPRHPGIAYVTGGGGGGPGWRASLEVVLPPDVEFQVVRQYESVTFPRIGGWTSSSDETFQARVILVTARHPDAVSFRRTTIPGISLIDTVVGTPTSASLRVFGEDLDRLHEVLRWRPALAEEIFYDRPNPDGVGQERIAVLHVVRPTPDQPFEAVEYHLMGDVLMLDSAVLDDHVRLRLQHGYRTYPLRDQSWLTWWQSDINLHGVEGPVPAYLRNEERGVVLIRANTLLDHVTEFTGRTIVGPRTYAPEVVEYYEFEEVLTTNFSSTRFARDEFEIFYEDEPYLVQVLGDSDTARRTAAIRWVTEFLETLRPNHAEDWMQSIQINYLPSAISPEYVRIGYARATQQPDFTTSAHQILDTDYALDLEPHFREIYAIRVLGSDREAVARDFIVDLLDTHSHWTPEQRLRLAHEFVPSVSDPEWIKIYWE